MTSKLTITDHRLAAIHAECEERDPAIVEIRAMIEELQERRKAAMDSEPVAWTSETALIDVACEETSMIGQEGVVGSIPLYRHAQPAPVVYSNFEDFWSVYIHPLAQDVIALTECCLAAMDSEPVAYTDERNLGCVNRGREMAYLWGKKNQEVADVALYRHAQQPVVPDGLVKAVAFYEQVKRENPPVETGAWKDAVDWVLKEACRAAMLQAGNSPAIPDGYVMVPKEPTEEMLQASYREAAVYSPTAYRAMIAAAPQPQNAPQNIPEIIPGWIPVSERMPEPNSEQRVCVYTPSPHDDMRYRFVPASLFKTVCKDATHWHYMKPPAAPQEPKP